MGAAERRGQGDEPEHDSGAIDGFETECEVLDRDEQGRNQARALLLDGEAFRKLSECQNLALGGRKWAPGMAHRLISVSPCSDGLLHSLPAAFGF
jgi:hypothetical protein